MLFGAETYDREWVRHDARDEHTRYSAARDALREALRQDLTETMVPHLLRFGDRNAMASSIENRVPFLTPELVELVGALPEEFLIDDAANSKAVFRQAMRGIVPDAILDRRDKIGFATPQENWLQFLREHLRTELAAACERGCRIFARARLEESVLRIGSPQGLRADYAWRILNVLLWNRLLGLNWS